MINYDTHRRTVARRTARQVKLACALIAVCVCGLIALIALALAP